MVLIRFTRRLLIDTDRIMWQKGERINIDSLFYFFLEKFWQLPKYEHSRRFTSLDYNDWMISMNGACENFGKKKFFFSQNWFLSTDLRYIELISYFQWISSVVKIIRFPQAIYINSVKHLSFYIVHQSNSFSENTFLFICWTKKKNYLLLIDGCALIKWSGSDTNV